MAAILKVDNITSASNTGTANLTLDASGNATVGGMVVPAQSFKRNVLINGNFQVAQRATTYALTNSVAYGSVDRWIFFQSGTANGTANQVASGLANFQYALRLGRNTSATTTGAIVAAQAIETFNSLPLAGQSVTLSFYAKAGANFSASSSNISVQVYSGTGTDQAASTWINSGWTGGAYPINTTQAITSSWVRYTFTGTVSSSATQLGALIQYTPVGFAGSDDYLYITGVQLEVGSVATPYERQIYSDQLIQCQRYLYKPAIDSGTGNSWLVPNAIWNSGTGGFSGGNFPVTMRTVPTLSTETATLSNYAIYTPSTFAYTNLTALNLNAVTTSTTFLLNYTTASGGTAGIPGYLVTNSTPNYSLRFSAEL